VQHEIVISGYIINDTPFPCHIMIIYVARKGCIIHDIFMNFRS